MQVTIGPEDCGHSTRMLPFVARLALPLKLRTLVALITVLCIGCSDTISRRKSDCEAMQVLKQRFITTGDVDALKQLEMTASGNDSFRRSYAIHTIGEIGPRAIQSTPLLFASLNSPDRVTQTAAISSLAKVTKGTDVAVRPLLVIVREGDDDICYFAVAALGDLGASAKAALPDLREIARSSRQNSEAAKVSIAKIERSIREVDAREQTSGNSGKNRQ